MNRNCLMQNPRFLEFMRLVQQKPNPLHSETPHREAALQAENKVLMNNVAAGFSRSATLHCRARCGPRSKHISSAPRIESNPLRRNCPKQPLAVNKSTTRWIPNWWLISWNNWMPS